MRRPPRSTLLPYTPLFRSRFEPAARRAVDAAMIDAEARGNATLDPAHLLLGLVANPAAPAVAALDLLGDRKSTRLNSSHAQYLVCRLLLEKKKTIQYSRRS